MHHMLKYTGLSNNVMVFKNIVFLVVITLLYSQYIIGQSSKINILNFQGDNGYEHASKENGLEMLEYLGRKNNWEVISTKDSKIFNLKDLMTFDVIVFNNNCGNEGRILTNEQQLVFQQYIKNGGGFVGIHCAGAIWNEEGSFQQWYEKLVGTKLVGHPEVQDAKLIIEDNTHISTKHLQKEWTVVDEWHYFSYSPRESVNVLMSVDEKSYNGAQKMGGDHPVTWYQYFDGGRSFFTSLGHTEEIYSDSNFQRLIEGGIIWAANDINIDGDLPILNDLLLDLDADQNILLEDGDRVSAWTNKLKNNSIKDFVKCNQGRKIPGSGRPRLKWKSPNLNGHNTIVFHRQELLNDNEEVFDKLITGAGYTWFSVMAVYEQVPDVPGVNSFFGNLRNMNNPDGKYEGLWAGLSDDNKVWMGSRNAITFGRWDKNNPQVISNASLTTNKYYVVAGRMEAGLGQAKMELFINEDKSLFWKFFPVNKFANASKMAIGQERMAIEHPGAESFDGEIARFLIYERPLSDDEMKNMMGYLKEMYNID